AFPDSIVFAGGASKGPLWCQIMADVLQVPVHTRVVKEASSLGAAIVAGVAVGLYADVQTATDRLVQAENTYWPDEKNKSVYQEALQRWETVYQAQLDLADRGITTSMWRAPGE
ncbi:MAG: hypothetical protein KC425_01695, partial [Anaerolineales bacterium]|nr:hypothetical protein [Anaerolineales bacterium]